MLSSLSIKNYALIEDIQVNFQEGFTVITGETGAGKSILLGALSLLLGKRADFGAIRNSDKKCVIEGTFQIAPYQLQSLFVKEDLDYEPQTIIRREILPSGKSRAFVNDTPANLASLQLLGAALIDIHSQHETLSLGESQYQFLVIDALADNTERIRTYQKSLEDLKNLQERMKRLREEQAQAAKEYDYNLFLLKELQQVPLESGIQEELEQRFEELNHVEELQEHLGRAVQVIQQEEIGAGATLREARAGLQRIAGISTSFQPLLERLQSLLIELDDIAAELEASLEKVEANPLELEEVNAKLQTLYSLQKKHMVPGVEELKEVEKELKKKVSVTENAEEEIARAQQDIDTKQKELALMADRIHQARKKVIPGFVQQVEVLLRDLGMPNASLRILLERQNSFFANGQDKLSWMLSANKGGKYNELKKAASGGEMSRIMLAVKSILATYSQLPTVIFDEIDTGISGEIGQKMADILQKMGRVMQVIAITHLPQIAGKGNSHFKIYKEDVEKTTVTYIRELKTEERVEELALMLGGQKQSASAMAHAKSLLN